MKLKRVKKLLVLGIVLVVMLTGCASTEAKSSGEEGERPLEGEKLVLAINATFPPFESVEVVDGETKFIGMDVDLVEKLSEKLGFSYEITDMAFAGLVGAIQSGRADFVCSGISPTAERLKNIDFSISYYYPGIAAVSRKD